MARQILVVLPHPDDEAFGLSGTLAKYIRDGAKVTYACLTLGEMGRNMGNPPFANRVTLPQVRKQELEASCRAIGIQDLRMLGFHDKTIEFEDQAVLDGKISSLLEELRPDLVVTFYPGYSVHPDHDATGAAVIRVISKLPAKERPVVHCLAFSKNCVKELGQPDIIMDIKPYLREKFAAMQAHRSQIRMEEFLKFPQEELEARFGTERFWTYRFDRTSSNLREKGAGK
jgi:bacillithiol biosynthesis deacetylase BshB2